MKGKDKDSKSKLTESSPVVLSEVEKPYFSRRHLTPYNGDYITDLVLGSNISKDCENSDKRIDKRKPRNEKDRVQKLIKKRKTVQTS